MKGKDFEIRGRAELECVGMFANCSYFSSNNYIYGGLFWSGEEDYARRRCQLLAYIDWAG
jgi:hypothetical protein